MKKVDILLKLIALSLIIPAFAFNSENKISVIGSDDQDTLKNYLDGTFMGQSRSHYTDEPYWGNVSVAIKDDFIKSVVFTIRDSALNEPFDSIYEKHFQGNDLYIQQCRNDWKGVQKYPGKLIESQDLNKIDAISGATWSFNIFRASLADALKKAKRVP